MYTHWTGLCGCVLHSRSRVGLQLDSGQRTNHEYNWLLPARLHHPSASTRAHNKTETSKVTDIISNESIHCYHFPQQLLLLLSCPASTYCYSCHRFGHKMTTKLSKHDKIRSNFLQASVFDGRNNTDHNSNHDWIMHIYTVYAKYTTNLSSCRNPGMHAYCVLTIYAYICVHTYVHTQSTSPGKSRWGGRTAA